MHNRVAPEVRGLIASCKRVGLGGAIGLALVVCAGVAVGTSGAPINVSALAAGPGAGPQQRQLEAASGQEKPSFALLDPNGIQHDLRRQAGRVVLVHFFATWCEPCRAELESMASLGREGQRGAVSILAVNVGEVPARVRRFVESTPVSFPVLLDSDRAVTKAWAVSVLPTTYVLDSKLVPRLLVEGDVDWSRHDIQAALARVGSGGRE
jgi:thiol-disulfide isomerase/thioredoxin